MSSTGDNTLSTGFRDAILDRFGFAQAPPADLEGLRFTYRAWCEHVPFDNLGKVISLRTAASALHGIYAAQFFESWLAGGNGATCWPSANALHALLHSQGFAARRVAGHMLDLGHLNHGSVIVTIEEREWLVDSSLLTDVPLPLRRETFVAHDPVFDSEVEFDGQGSAEPGARSNRATYVLWTQAPSNPVHIPCRIFLDEVSHGEYLQRYEATREHSPFNSRLCARRNCEGTVRMLLGNKRYVKSVSGVETRELSRDEVLDSLRVEFNMAEILLDRWVAAGGLNAAFEVYTGPSFPPETRKPPSRRGLQPA